MGTGLMSAVVLGVGVGLVLDASASAREADEQQAALASISKNCEGAGYPTCASIDYLRHKRDLSLDTAIPLLAIGGVGIVTTIIVAIVRAPSGDDVASGASGRVVVTPALSPEGGGLRMRARF